MSANIHFRNFGTFQVLTAASVKMTAFWDIAPRGLDEVDLRFRGMYCSRHYPGDVGTTHL
jgi:hypothetical protein